jgi:hypothetical protein
VSVVASQQSQDCQFASDVPIDTDVADRYSLIVAPDPGSCGAQIGEQHRGPDYFIFSIIDPGLTEYRFRHERHMTIPCLAVARIDLNRAKP